MGCIYARLRFPSQKKWAVYIRHPKFLPLRLQDTPMMNRLCLCVTPISLPWGYRTRLWGMGCVYVRLQFPSHKEWAVYICITLCFLPWGYKTRPRGTSIYIGKSKFPSPEATGYTHEEQAVYLGTHWLCVSSHYDGWRACLSCRRWACGDTPCRRTCNDITWRGQFFIFKCGTCKRPENILENI